MLVAAAAGLPRLKLVEDPDLGLEPGASRTLMGWVRRRARREPVAYILGSKAFRRIELAVDSRVLIPRPETELLVEIAVELAPDGGRVHDVGTGSGAVALALKDERPDLHVSASDRAPVAAEVARRNAERLGLEIEVATAPGCRPGEYDLVVANLPYVRRRRMGRAAARDRTLRAARGAPGRRGRARRDPRPRGGRARRRRFWLWSTLQAQAQSVREMLAEASTRADLAGRERVTIGFVPS